jgi:predicted HD superfamily hydrolase involved in NAD metabolism
MKWTIVFSKPVSFVLQMLDLAPYTAQVGCPYVSSRGYVGSNVSIEDELKAWLKPRVTPERYQHVIGVYFTVEALAIRHAIDPEPLRLASLLHDCMRDTPDAEMLVLADEWGLRVRPVDRENPILLHGALAAAIARRDWRISDPAVLNPILTHTSGHKSMSASDKVFFLADRTEPTRAYPRVNEIWIAAFVDLDEAVLLACDLGLAHNANNAGVDPDTVELRQVTADVLSRRRS